MSLKQVSFYDSIESLFNDLDDNYYLIYDNNLSYLRDFFKFKFILPVQCTEDSKSIKTALEIIEILINNNFTRGDTLVLLGGGLLLDLGGFVSSILYRGVNVIYIPTTLLGMVDACYGGKTAINFLNTKNVLGSFKHPNKILINHNFLSSLDHNNCLAGFGEVLKYYFISGFSIDYKDDILSLISNCLNLKDEFVSSDFLDLNKRQILNFGHTFGHVYELKYNILHGFSVILGIKSILDLELFLNYINKDEYDFYLNKLNEFLSYFNIKLDFYDFREHIKYIQHDKKNFNNIINFIFIKDNKVFIEKINLGDLNALFSL